MKTFPTLYKRTKTGAIQEYKLWVDQVHDTTDGVPVIVKSTGQLGGKHTIHNESVLEGKNIGKTNETTPEQQAILQAESDWKRKQDEGYKSLESLGILEINGLHSAYGKDGQFTLEGILQQLPKFNTTLEGNPKPMLAKAIDWNKVKYPCYVQPKLDGVRCLMVVDFHNEAMVNIKFLSRSGKEYTTLNHIVCDVLGTSNKLPSNFVLDGEIYSDTLSFQEIVAAVKKQRPDSLKLRFRAYDIVTTGTQKERWSETVRIVDAIASPHVWPVITRIADEQSLIKVWHDEWVQEGYEGAMVRHFHGIYGQGQRSSDLLKVKEFDETEFAFKNFEFGQRGVEDLIAVCWDASGAKEFRAKMVGTKAEKEVLYAEGDIHEGQSLTVKHFGLTDDGLPRFPIGKAFRNY